MVIFNKAIDTKFANGKNWFARQNLHKCQDFFQNSFGNVTKIPEWLNMFGKLACPIMSETN